MLCDEYKDGIRVVRTGDKIKLVPENTETLVCSACGREFTTRGLVDYAFAYMDDGIPVYVVRPDVLCYECDDEKKRKSAEDTFSGGPLNNVEV